MKMTNDNFVSETNFSDILSQTIKVKDLLSSDVCYGIRDFQRQYKWEKDEIEQLMIDIDGSITMNPKGIFLGPIIFSSVNKGEIDENYFDYEIVDGQQRITTITFIIKMIELFTGNDESKYYSINSDDMKQPKCKFTPLRGRNVFDDLLLNFNKSEIVRNEGNESRDNSFDSRLKILKNENGQDHKIFTTAYKTIFNYIKDNLETNISEFKEKLLESSLVMIKIPGNIPSTEIFESINSKGRPLVIDELIKNYFYMKAGKFYGNEENFSDIKKQLEIRFLDIKNNFKNRSQGVFPSLKRYYHSYINFKWAYNSSKEKDLEQLPISENNDRALYKTYRTFSKIENKRDFARELDSIDRYIKTIGHIRDKARSHSNDSFEDFKFKLAAHSLTTTPMLMPIIFYLSEELNEFNRDKTDFELTNDFKLCMLKLYKFFILCKLDDDKKKLKLSYNFVSYIIREKEKHLENTLGYADVKDIFINLIESLTSSDDQKAVELKMRKLHIPASVVKAENISRLQIYHDNKQNEFDSLGFDLNYKILFAIVNNYISDSSKIPSDEFRDVEYESFYEGGTSYTAEHIIAKNNGLEQPMEGIYPYEFRTFLMNSISNIILIKGKDSLANKSTEEKIPEIYLPTSDHCTNMSNYFSKIILDGSGDNMRYHYWSKGTVKKWVDELCNLIIGSIS